MLSSVYPSPPSRSPSPEPIYNSEGKRLNTREYRTRKKIEEERHSLITEMVGLNPDFKPPADYKYVCFRVLVNLMSQLINIVSVIPIYEDLEHRTLMNYNKYSVIGRGSCVKYVWLVETHFASPKASSYQS